MIKQGRGTIRNETSGLLEELQLCCSTKNLKRGKQAHAVATERGNDSCLYIATTLVKMYANCGSMPEAQQVFDSINHPDLVCWNALILGYALNGNGAIALDLFARMKAEGFSPDRFAFVAALKACGSLVVEINGAACLTRVQEIHSEIGIHFNTITQNTLVDMYSKCGSMAEADKVFNSIEEPNVISWTSLISGYADNGEGAMALELFSRMKREGCTPNTFTYVAALKGVIALSTKDEMAKSDILEMGKKIHTEIGSLSNTIVQNALIDMYAKCGSMLEAYEVFQFMKHRDDVSWTTIILGYAENGEGSTSLKLFTEMKAQGCTPSYVTFAAALKACELLGAFESGCKIHAEIDFETESKPIVVTCLVSFYAKCGNIAEARTVFDAHPKTRDLRTWTALLMGYSRLGDTEAVFEMFECMQDLAYKPDGVTFLCVLACCSHAGMVQKACEVFQDMYSKYGVVPMVDHYNCVVDILGRSNRLGDAIFFVRGMHCVPVSVTWMTVLGACRKWKNVEIGTLAFQSVVSIYEANTSTYLLMEHIYGSVGMWEEREMVFQARNIFKYKHGDGGESHWTNEGGIVHTFIHGALKGSACPKRDG